MNIDEKIRRAASETRSAYVERPQPTIDRISRLAVTRRIGALATIVVASITIGVMGLLALNGPNRGETIAGWTSDRSQSALIEYSIPESGWNVIEQSLTPDLASLPDDASERTLLGTYGARYKDTILSFATYTPRPSSASSTACLAKPVAALRQIGPDDVLVSILEQTEEIIPELPARPLSEGTTPAELEEFYPVAGEINDDGCYDLANEGRPEPLFHREYVFHDQGRAFVITVAMGSQVDDDTRTDTWRILQSLEFETRR